MRFREVQRERWGPWRVAMLVFGLYVCLGFAGSVKHAVERGVDPMDLVFHLPIFLLIGVGMPLAALFGRFETLVDDAGLRLRRVVLGFAFRKRRIPLDRIASAQLGSCHPNIDHGSWGTHTGGPEGVRVRLDGGQVVQIATSRPEELVAALTSPEEDPAAGSPRPGSPSSP